MSDMNLTPIDEDAVEAGYPVAELNETLDAAQEKFLWALADWPEGDNWSDKNPRRLARAVDRNARSAAFKMVDGDFMAARKELGDALNYLLFLQAIVGRWEAESHE